MKTGRRNNRRARRREGVREVDIFEFFQKLKKHCKQFSDGNGDFCEQCDFRDLCFTPPITLTDEIVARSLERLAEFQSD